MLLIALCREGVLLGVPYVSRFGLGVGATFLGPWVVYCLLLVEGPEAGVLFGGLGTVVDRFHIGYKGPGLLVATGTGLGLECFVADCAGLCNLLLNLGGGEGAGTGERFRL